MRLRASPKRVSRSRSNPDNRRFARTNSIISQYAAYTAARAAASHSSRGQPVTDHTATTTEPATGTP